MSPGVLTSREIILQTDYFWLSGRAEGVRLTETFEDGTPQTPEITAIFSPSLSGRSSTYTSTILVLKDDLFLMQHARMFEIFISSENTLVTPPPPLFESVNGTMQFVPQPEIELLVLEHQSVSKTLLDLYLIGPLVLVQLQQDYIEDDVDAKPSNISTDIYVVFKNVSRVVSRILLLYVNTKNPVQ